MTPSVIDWRESSLTTGYSHQYVCSYDLSGSYAPTSCTTCGCSALPFTNQFTTYNNFSEVINVPYGLATRYSVTTKLWQERRDSNPRQDVLETYIIAAIRLSCEKIWSEMRDSDPSSLAWKARAQPLYQSRSKILERREGIEPSPTRWQRIVLPIDECRSKLVAVNGIEPFCEVYETSKFTRTIHRVKFGRSGRNRTFYAALMRRLPFRLASKRNLVRLERLELPPVLPDQFLRLACLPIPSTDALNSFFFNNYFLAFVNVPGLYRKFLAGVNCLFWFITHFYFHNSGADIYD